MYLTLEYQLENSIHKHEKPDRAFAFPGLLVIPHGAYRTSTVDLSVFDYPLPR